MRTQRSGREEKNRQLGKHTVCTAKAVPDAYVSTPSRCSVMDSALLMFSKAIVVPGFLLLLRSKASLAQSCAKILQLTAQEDVASLTHPIHPLAPRNSAPPVPRRAAWPPPSEEKSQLRYGSDGLTDLYRATGARLGFGSSQLALPIGGSCEGGSFF
jgi:hypothetical protein